MIQKNSAALVGYRENWNTVFLIFYLGMSQVIYLQYSYDMIFIKNDRDKTEK